MTPEQIFDIANPAATIGWLALALTPLAPVWTNRVAMAVAIGLSALYTALALAFFAGADGGYDTLPNVITLLSTPELVLTGWVHFLAFDLFVGAWAVRVARREGIAHALVLPCLVGTLLFGPAGLVLFLAIRAAYQMRAQAA